MNDWFVFHDSGDHVGPVTIDLLAKGIVAGRVPRDARIARGAASGDWQPATAVPELVARLGELEGGNTVADIRPLVPDDPGTAPDLTEIMRREGAASHVPTQTWGPLPADKATVRDSRPSADPRSGRPQMSESGEAPLRPVSSGPPKPPIAPRASTPAIPIAPPVSLARTMSSAAPPPQAPRTPPPPPPPRNDLKATIVGMGPLGGAPPPPYGSPQHGSAPPPPPPPYGSPQQGSAPPAPAPTASGSGPAPAFAPAPPFAPAAGPPMHGSAPAMPPPPTHPSAMPAHPSAPPAPPAAHPSMQMQGPGGPAPAWSHSPSVPIMAPPQLAPPGGAPAAPPPGSVAPAPAPAVPPALAGPEPPKGNKPEEKKDEKKEPVVDPKLALMIPLGSFAVFAAIAFLMTVVAVIVKPWQPPDEKASKTHVGPVVSGAAEKK